LLQLRLTLAVVVLVLANLTDAIVTLTLLELNVAHELNPLMKWAYECSPVTFVSCKLLMVQAGLLLAAATAHTRALTLVSRGGALLYSGVVAYQIVLVATLRFAA
jgi:hypothetical protein